MPEDDPKLWEDNEVQIEALRNAREELQIAIDEVVHPVEEDHVMASIQEYLTAVQNIKSAKNGDLDRRMNPDSEPSHQAEKRIAEYFEWIDSKED